MFKAWFEIAVDPPPKDGSLILVANGSIYTEEHGEAHKEHGFVTDQEPRVRTAWWDGEAWRSYVEDGGYYGRFDVAPTHWLPLEILFPLPDQRKRDETDV